MTIWRDANARLITKKKKPKKVFNLFRNAYWLKWFWFTFRFILRSQKTFFRKRCEPRHINKKKKTFFSIQNHFAASAKIIASKAFKNSSTIDTYSSFSFSFFFCRTTYSTAVFFLSHSVAGSLTYIFSLFLIRYANLCTIRLFSLKKKKTKKHEKHFYFRCVFSFITFSVHWAAFCWRKHLFQYKRRKKKMEF